MSHATPIFCTECGARGELCFGTATLRCGHSKSFRVPLNDGDCDARSDTEKMLWEKLGPPLYYCDECMLAVSVTPRDGQEPLIERKCLHADAPIIAPRKSILAGKGGLNLRNRAKLSWWQLLATLTGRCV